MNTSLNSSEATTMAADFGVPQLQQIIVTALASLLGALVAGYFTARWAVRKLRGERAFDRRLDWLEEVLRKLISTRLALDAAVFGEHHDELAASRDTAWSEFQGLLTELMPMLNATGAYGTPRMVGEITVFGDRLQKGLVELAAITEVRPEEYPEAFLSAMAEAAAIMRSVEGQIQAQIRAHLGLEMFGVGEIDRATRRAIARAEGKVTDDPLLPLKMVARLLRTGRHTTPLEAAERTRGSKVTSENDETAA